MSEIIGNRYQITKLIGKGGMAEVYLAWDSILNREVAIKILKSDMSNDDIALERFKREASATTKLSHPNIVDVYDVGDDGDSHYIVMEYVKGYTLKQLIKKRGAIPYKEAVWMMKQLAGALMEAHRKGIIHRDVKSQNVLIKPDGTIKLSDFGIALANGAMQITSKDSVLGSVHYLAPELSKGRQASMQSDIYSLGIVFYELLTGDVPYKAETPVQVALMHVKNSIPSVRKFNPEIPQSVENIVIKSTAKQLTDRYRNIALMLQDLNVCLKPEHLDDKKLIIGDINYLKSSLKNSGENTENDNKKLPKFIIIILSIVSVIAIVAILFLSGIIGDRNTLVQVPNVANLTVLEAKDILSKSNLKIDESRIVYELSDHIEKDKIISISPDVGSEVEPNYKIKLTVSSGIYSVLDNYIGKNYKDAEKDLSDKNFYINFKTKVDSNKQPGTIVEQSLEEGYKYNPNVRNEIVITYTITDTIIIDPSVLGMSLDDAAEYFTENNIKFEFVKLDIDEFKDEEIEDSKPETVIKTSPEIGSSYVVDSDVEVKVYYFEGDN